MEPATMGGADGSTVRLDEFTRDERLRYRGPRANERVEDYAEAFSDHGWGDFPPLKLIRLTEEHVWHTEEQTGTFAKTKRKKHTYAAGTLLLIGGFTRAKAADEAGLSEAPAVIVEGDWNEALLIAWGENGTHGRPRDRDELWAVLDSIHDHPDHKSKSEKDVAFIANTSRSTVNRYRTERRERMARAAASMSGSSSDSSSPSLTSAIIALVDSWNQDVPETLVEDFRVVPAAKKLTQHLRETAAKLLSLKYGSELGTQCQEPGLERWDVRDLAGLLMEWADRGEDSLPFLVCPACDGAKTLPDPQAPKKQCRCEQCIGRGFLLRNEASTLKPEFERKARAAA